MHMLYRDTFCVVSILNIMGHSAISLSWTLTSLVHSTMTGISRTFIPATAGEALTSSEDAQYPHI